MYSLEIHRALIVWEQQANQFVNYVRGIFITVLLASAAPRHSKIHTAKHALDFTGMELIV